MWDVFASVDYREEARYYISHFIIRGLLHVGGWVPQKANNPLLPSSFLFKCFCIFREGALYLLSGHFTPESLERSTVKCTWTCPNLQRSVQSSPKPRKCTWKKFHRLSSSHHHTLTIFYWTYLIAISKHVYRRLQRWAHYAFAVHSTTRLIVSNVTECKEQRKRIQDSKERYVFFIALVFYSNPNIFCPQLLIFPLLTTVARNSRLLR